MEFITTNAVLDDEPEPDDDKDAKKWEAKAAATLERTDDLPGTSTYVLEGVDASAL